MKMKPSDVESRNNMSNAVSGPCPISHAPITSSEFDTYSEQCAEEATLNLSGGGLEPDQVGQPHDGIGSGLPSGSASLTGVHPLSSIAPCELAEAQTGRKPCSTLDMPEVVFIEEEETC